MAGIVFPMSFVRRRRSLTAIPTRDIRISQGEDLQFEIHLYEQEGDAAPLDLRYARAWFAVQRRHHYDGCWDYGLQGWIGAWETPLWSVNASAIGTVQIIDQDLDTTTPLPLIRMDIPSQQTVHWHGDYQFVLQMDFDGATNVMCRGGLVVERAALPSRIPFNDMGNDASPDVEALGQGS